MFVLYCATLLNLFGILNVFWWAFFSSLLCHVQMRIDFFPTHILSLTGQLWITLPELQWMRAVSVTNFFSFPHFSMNAFNVLLVTRYWEWIFHVLLAVGGKMILYIFDSGFLSWMNARFCNMLYCTNRDDHGSFIFASLYVVWFMYWFMYV